MSLNNIIGPIMVGPSSSHTAGAVRIGLMARILLKDTPLRGEILLHGSFAGTGKGSSFELARERNFTYTIGTSQLPDAHPNTALIRLVGVNGREIEVQASSVGGGRVMVNKIDGINVNFSGESPTLIVHNLDQPGHVAEVTSMLAHKSVNIATMQLYRERRGEYAVMVVETDQSIPDNAVSWLEHLEGIIKVTYFNGL